MKVHIEFLINSNLFLNQNFSLEDKKEVVGSFDLYMGINRFCLAEPGIYNLIPKSCHRFEQDVYRYDT
jgi:hypothetical protein